MYLSGGVQESCCLKWYRTGLGQEAPKTVERTSQDPALVLDRSKFKSLLCHQRARVNIY